MKHETLNILAKTFQPLYGVKSQYKMKFSNFKV
jgi:hypothetical protein